jgi:hypothetical protein
MNYNYEKTTEKLGEFKIIKFRAGVAPTKEGVMLSI